MFDRRWYINSLSFLVRPMGNALSLTKSWQHCGKLSSRSTIINGSALTNPLSSTSTLSVLTCGKASAYTLITDTPKHGSRPITLGPLSSRSNWIWRCDLNSVPLSRIARLRGRRNDRGSVAERRRTGGRRRGGPSLLTKWSLEVFLPLVYVSCSSVLKWFSTGLPKLRNLTSVYLVQHSSCHYSLEYIHLYSTL